MYATLVPPLKNVRLPVSRDQAMLLLVAFTELGLALETFLAHSISGTIVAREWISIIFGVVSGVLLLIAGAIALRNRPLAVRIATATLLVSIAVGLLGAYFHIRRAALFGAPPGEQLSINLLVWAPPVLGPLTYAMAGLLGLSAAYPETPVNSGRLNLWGSAYVQMPLSKTRAYFLIVSLGVLSTLISSVLDHARTPFANPGLWISVGVGVFGIVVPFLMGIFRAPTRADLWLYLLAMLALIGVGLLGVIFHVSTDLTSSGEFVIERFIRGAPFLAPMLFALMGTYGLVVLLGPDEE